MKSKWEEHEIGDKIFAILKEVLNYAPPKLPSG